MKGPDVDPRNPQKSQVLVFEISVLVRQRVVYLWGSLDSQPSLLGDLMASERAYLKTTMTKTKKKKTTRRFSGFPTHVHILRHTCRHTQVCMYLQTYTFRHTNTFQTHMHIYADTETKFSTCRIVKGREKRERRGKGQKKNTAKKNA